MGDWAANRLRGLKAADTSIQGRMLRGAMRDRDEIIGQIKRAVDEAREVTQKEGPDAVERLNEGWRGLLQMLEDTSELVETEPDLRRRAKLMDAFNHAVAHTAYLSSMADRKVIRDILLSTRTKKSREKKKSKDDVRTRTLDEAWLQFAEETGITLKVSEDFANLHYEAILARLPLSSTDPEETDPEKGRPSLVTMKRSIARVKKVISKNRGSR